MAKSGIVKRKIQMIEMDMICTRCNDGYMRPDPIVHMTNPPQYPHTCEKCGQKAVFDVRYPCITYVYKDNGAEVRRFL